MANKHFKIKISHKYFSIVSGIAVIVLLASIGVNILFESHAQTPGAPASPPIVLCNNGANSNLLQSPYTYDSDTGANGTVVSATQNTVTVSGGNWSTGSYISFVTNGSTSPPGTYLISSVSQNGNSWTITSKTNWINGAPTANMTAYNDGESYTSGTANLPTYGTMGSDFPNVTAGIVVPATDNTSPAQQSFYSTSNTVYYFEPGMHTLYSAMSTGANSVYIGGYDSVSGEATLNGVNGAGGAYLSIGPSGTTDSDQNWEYLTIENFSSSLNGTVLGVNKAGGFVDGNSYKYNTIGPNMWSNQSGTLIDTQDFGAGYAISGGNNTIVEDNCIQNDGQGGVNISPGYGDETVTGAVVTNNDFYANGLGNYPDLAPNPYSCGCAGDAGKYTATVNFIFEDNYVHGGYSQFGIWGDTNNVGADIQYNYISDNWGRAIDYEASYNANISDNTIIDNGWGSWPSSSYMCNGLTCTDGLGIAPGGIGYDAVWLPGSGGNSLIPSDFSGQLLFENNELINNFGGLQIYTDGGSGIGQQGGSNSKGNNPLASADIGTYYLNWNDARASNASWSTTGGTTTVTNSGGFLLERSYGTNDGMSTQFAPNPSVTSQPYAGTTIPTAGEKVFGLGSSVYTVAASPAPTSTSFTITTAATPSSGSGTYLEIGTTGGCGIADLYGTTAPGNSGTPPANYWQNCIMGSQNVTVSGNTFSMNTSTIGSTCTSANQCGFMGAIANAPSIRDFYEFYNSYFPDNIALASSPLNNVWSDNSYCFEGGGGFGGWQFQAGSQGNNVSQSAWQSTYGQELWL